jgi:hypothetical protein
VLESFVQDIEVATQRLPKLYAGPLWGSKRKPYQRRKSQKAETESPKSESGN